MSNGIAPAIRPAYVMCALTNENETRREYYPVHAWVAYDDYDMHPLILIDGESKTVTTRCVRFHDGRAEVWTVHDGSAPDNHNGPRDEEAWLSYCTHTGTKYTRQAQR
ncbi:hypothetical protein AAFP35_10055 [Gordonia sp. CPCC 206044]|uniref:hypothetical protein n=1 Tax=Gordonia sp. CPCC 206044 TaxID=3140793 RepID=UPI003AF3DD30